MSYSCESDEQLMVLFATTQDERAFAELFDRYNKRIINWLIRRWMRTTDQAEDLMADTWLRAVDAAERFDVSRGRVQSWLFTIAGNLAKNSLRAESREITVNMTDCDRGEQYDTRPTEYADTTSLTAPELVKAERLATASAWALMMIPTLHREVLLHRLFSQTTYAYLARHFDLPEGTIKSRLFRARKVFRLALPVAERHVNDLRRATAFLPNMALFRWARETYPHGYVPSRAEVAFLMREHTGEAVSNPYYEEQAVDYATISCNYEFTLPRSTEVEYEAAPCLDTLLQDTRWAALHKTLISSHNKRRTDPSVVLLIRAQAERTPNLQNGGRPMFLQTMKREHGVGTSVVAQVIRGELWGVRLGSDLRQIQTSSP